MEDPEAASSAPSTHLSSKSDSPSSEDLRAGLLYEWAGMIHDLNERGLLHPVPGSAVTLKRPDWMKKRPLSEPHETSVPETADPKPPLTCEVNQGPLTFTIESGNEAIAVLHCGRAAPYGPAATRTPYLKLVKEPSADATRCSDATGVDS